MLKAQITGTSKAITNTQRANSLMAMADSGLAQIGNLLNDIKGLVVESANTGTMTAAQIAANQMQVDAALDSIDRIARTTNYGGKKLLDGSLGFQTAGMGPGISNVQINTANFGTANAVGVNVNVQAAADYARLISNGTGVGVDTVFDVIGNIGSATVSVGAGSTNDDIAAAINRSSDSTGVLAYVEGKESYGSIVLSSAGAGNDIVVTALQAGLDAGNYEFRITRGDTNDARVVQEAAAGQPGIIEISLVAAQESRYTNFAGLFDINIDTTNRDNPESAATSVTMTQGAANNVTYNSVAKAASTNVIDGKTLIANAYDANNANINSQLNGWTIAVDDRIATSKTHTVADTNTKTIYVNSTSFENSDVLNSAIKNALANTVDGTVADFNKDARVDLKIIGNDTTFGNGDRFTFAGGAAEGELAITYAAGATANDILKMLNAAPNVSASLAGGVNGSDTIANMPNGLTNVNNGGQNFESRYSSGATAQEVIDLINSQLGDKFLATGLSSDTGTGGRVGFMDASAIHGDINLGNALRFSGMDNGPIVRLTTLGTNGMPIANQKLGVNIIHPTEADKAAGIHTPILEIRLATDAQGNSITMASDIAKLFNSLTKEQTMGVSVSQLYPPGVDPNGRIFGVSECGEAIVIDTCPTPIDGIVQPTGVPGVCGPMEGDIVLLGGNQMIVADNAVAKIAGHNRPVPDVGPVSTIPSVNPPPLTVTVGGFFTFNYDIAVALAEAGISFAVAEGARGEQGATGTPGADGTPGTPGTPGTDGIAGDPDGTDGTDGGDGGDGADGGKGGTGEQGPDAIATFRTGIITINMAGLGGLGGEGGPGGAGGLGGKGGLGGIGYADEGGANGLDGEDGEPGEPGEQGEVGDVGAVGNDFANFGELLASINAVLEEQGFAANFLTSTNTSLITGVEGYTDTTMADFAQASGSVIAPTAVLLPPTTYGPTLEITAEVGYHLGGVEFQFVTSTGAAGTNDRWIEATNTLVVDLGSAWVVGANGNDATLQTLIRNAIQKQSIFNAMEQSLSFDPLDNVTAAQLAAGITVKAGSTIDTGNLSTTKVPPVVLGIAQSAGVPGASAAAEPKPSEITLKFNGAEFKIEAFGNTEAFSIKLDASAASSSWTAATTTTPVTPAVLNLGISGYSAATHGSTAEDFATFLNSTITSALFNAGTAGLPPGTTNVKISVKDNFIGPDSWNDAAVLATAADVQTAWEAQNGLSTRTVPKGTAQPKDNAGATILRFDSTSAMNGLTFAFTREEDREGFNATTGELTIFLGSEFEKLQDAIKTAAEGSPARQEAENKADAALRAAVNGAIHANWESIRAFTGEGNTKTNTAVLELDRPVKLSDSQHDAFTVANALRDAKLADNPFGNTADGKTMITGSYFEGTITGRRGVGKDDAVMSITAKEAGTHMAGINIHFVNDTNSGLEQWNTAYDKNYGAGDKLPELRVVLQTNTDGSRELIIIGNLGTESKSELNAGLLARALNAATIQDMATGKQFAFNSMFDANALQFAPGSTNGHGTAGSVLFNRDVSGAQGTTVGGYRVSSGDGSATSSGIGMLGQSDANERLVIESQELGSSQFIQINMIDGYLNTVNAWGETSNYGTGQDMLATINGTRATTDGNHISINTSDLSLSMSVANAVGNTGFTITGGGAMFQLGPDVVSQQQMRVGIASMLTTNLGGKDGYIYLLKEGGIAALNSSDAGRRLADRIVNQAIENVAVQRGRLGAIQKGSLEPNIVALQDSLTAMTEANALISNADFAVESSNLTRFQLLIQSGMQTLGIANQMPQYAAQLVR